MLIFTSSLTSFLITDISGYWCVFFSMELCREDPLCSSVTVCTSDGGSYNGPSVGCPVEFGASNCALHRQQEFQNGIVTPGVSTLVPIRRDLRPVTVRGFAVHGHPLVSSKQLTDLASCARLCSRTPDCRVVSFSQHSTGHKSCRLFHNVTMNELRVQGHSTVRRLRDDVFISLISNSRTACFHDGNFRAVLLRRRSD